MYPWLINDFERLSLRLVQNRLHHGLLVIGPQGIGKSDFCHELAGFLLCKNHNENGVLKRCGKCQGCMLFEAQTHPDFHRIQSDKQVGVDLIRIAIDKLLGKAQLTGNKVLVIEAAETMTESAANALLKTLEEPTDNTFIFLVTDKPERLLPTILSRCEKIHLNPPNTIDCVNWLQEQGVSDVEASFIKVYTQRPLKILSELNKDKGVNYPDFKTSIAALVLGDKNSIELAEAWQNEAVQIVNWLQHSLRENVIHLKQSKGFWLCQDNLNKATHALTNPGVNRVLILTGLLNSYVEVVKTTT